MKIRNLKECFCYKFSINNSSSDKNCVTNVCDKYTAEVKLKID